jgi:BirA family biotin operon repressor/biotin-[acetyl-CoA-carboxylase] ligase
LLDNSSFSFLQHHLHLSEVSSTNDVAKQLAEENLVKQGYVITTDYQNKGRGQGGSGWESERGKNIICSLVLNSNISIDFQLYLNISMCLAVYDLVKQYCIGADVSIKWPNDVYVNDKKVAGILIENSVQGAVIKQSIVGIGVNINQVEFDSTKATSLSAITGSTYELEECIRVLLHQLEYRYHQLLAGAHADLWHEYHEFFYRRNKKTQFNTDQVLLVENEVKTFNMKEIAWV